MNVNVPDLPAGLTYRLHNRLGMWIGHLLDYDLVVSAATEEEAFEKLKICTHAYVQYGKDRGWDADIPFPAPKEFWRHDAVSTTA
jgi:hypothetical protein